MGAVVKEESAVDLHICLAFPDTYEVGMSHLGLQILYDIANRKEGVWAERAFMPLPDMVALLRERNLPLFSLEGRRPLCGFDMLGFSLQYELCATNVLAMLDLGAVPLHAADRSAAHPLVIGGGPLALHPEPLAPFFDLFSLGDGEELLEELISTLRRSRQNRLSRKDTLKQMAQIEGVYVPSLLEAGQTGSTAPCRRIISSLDKAPHPVSPVIPHVKAVHDRLGIEVMRGCLRGCRFCQAGYIYRPQRERSPADVLQIAEKSMASTGYDELALLSLSTADYSSIIPLVAAMRARFAATPGTFVSFPSTRIDAMTPEFLDTAASLSHSGITIAPEAGTQRMRNVINKGMSDEQIIDTCCRIFSMGWKSIKMYFMIGLPTETDDDVYAIADLSGRIAQASRRARDLTVSVSTLVPKPHTPFQWAEQLHPDEVFRRYRLLIDEFRRLRIRFRYHDYKAIFLEGVISRGERRVSEAILHAYRLGCSMDGWTEHFDLEKWLEAFRQAGIDPYSALRGRALNEPLPWDHIDAGLGKPFLMEEWEKSLQAVTTEDCKQGSCGMCGVCDHSSICNISFPDARLSDPQLPAASARRDAIQRVRLRFHKQGPARFLSHLEMQLAFQRAMKRSSIPIAFSRAFHSQPRLQFGPPLQLGIESSSELVDLFLSETSSPAEIIARLNPALPSGLHITEAFVVPLEAKPVQTLIRNATYRAVFSTPPAIPGEGNWQEIRIERLRAGRAVSIALKDYVTSVSLSDNELEFTIRYDQDGSTLRPMEVLQALAGSLEQHVRLAKTAVAMAAP